MGSAAEKSRRLSAGDDSEASTARRYAEHLLLSLALRQGRQPSCADEHPAITWANSGLMALTGLREGEPLMCPLPLAACADGALAALASLGPQASFAGLRGSQLMGERAAVAGLSRGGASSPGGACRLLEAADGWIAVNLARPDDWDLVPAWLESGECADWEPVAKAVRARSAVELIERGRMMGMAVALDTAPGTNPEPWFSVSSPSHQQMPRAGRNGRQGARPLVLDLSSLWAGPLCGHLLHKLGANVIKVESPVRPDGARQGPAVIFNLLNAGKQNLALDARIPRGRDRLRALVAKADIVIESSRPRALRQLGIVAEDLVMEHPGLTWLSITGHGRGEPRGNEPQENWIAYGDDAGVAAGLSSVMELAAGQRVIVGDAIADPLTGMHAALAAWAGYQSGGGLYSLSLRQVVSHCMSFDRPASVEALRARQQDWTHRLAGAGLAAARPQLRNQNDWARELGADTQAVLRQLGISD